MLQRDEFAAMNQKLWDAHATRGDHNSSRPKDSLDVEAFSAYREGKLADLPEPLNKRLPDSIIMRRAIGRSVLCLASGGGHQSTEYGLLGADVTVLDLSRKQLELDERMARQYGYPLRVVQGDMRNLSALESASFDIVVQGVGMCFVPEMRLVYQEVARVLRRGGYYSVTHCNPFTYPISFDGPDNGWDGVGYRISAPYCGGPIRRGDNGSEGMTEGAITGEYRHLLRDIFNDLIESGLIVRGVWESAEGDTSAPPGSSAHAAAFVPEYFTILAVRGHDAGEPTPAAGPEKEESC